MKRVCNDNKLTPEKANNRNTEIHSKRKSISKNYEFYRKIAKFNAKRVKNM